MSDIDHKYTDEVVCPWCGNNFTDSLEFSDEGEIECDCGKSFDYTRNYTIDYSTTRAECETGKCELELSDDTLDNPYIHNGRNWTNYTCRICRKEIYKVSSIVGDKPRLELPTLLDFK